MNYTPDQEPNDIRVIGEGVHKVYDEIFDGCPREKEQALEEVLRSISRLY